jgi:predicted phosphoadenosine phosphosulfate sulfurtransferase
MHQAGLTLHQMRICEPYGDEQRKGLWLYHLLEPQTWAKVVNRVAGASSASLYATESGNILGNRKIYLPDGHTWQSYAMLILRTMPPATAEHYKDKISVYIKYCMDHYGMSSGLPDCVDGDTSSKDVPSWRRICRCLLRNDYWCKSLSFSVTKSEAYEKYRKMMKQRRDKWQII